MAEKKIDNEALDKVSGGAAAAFAALKEEVRGMIPVEVQEKLNAAKDDVAIRRVLAENGIDVEKIEQKFAHVGFDKTKFGVQEISNEALEKVSGGFDDDGVEVYCKCGANSRDDFTYHFWGTIRNSNAYSIYTCDKCGNYVIVTNHGNLEWIDKDEYLKG